MMNTGQIDRDLEQGPVTIRALRSLTHSHAGFVVQAVEALPTKWSVDLHDDYNGYLALVISPVGQNNDPTFLLSGTVDQIELAELRDDHLCALRRFTTLQAACTSLAEQMAASGK